MINKVNESREKGKKLVGFVIGMICVIWLFVSVIVFLFVVYKISFYLN